MKIAVSILNWNGVDLLKKFLPKVIKYSSNIADIYIIDNASTDSSISYVRMNYPNIKIIINPKNYGYAEGYNEGLKKIDADIFCLLNNDVEVTKNWIAPIIKQFKKDPSTKVIQPKILNFHNREYFDHAGACGGYIDKFGYPYCRGRIHNLIEKDLKQYDYNKEIFWASGACLFIKKDIFENYNGFDKTFFNHMEEIDLCWRIKNDGNKIMFVYNSKVFHIGGGTLKYKSTDKTYYNFRNSLYTISKNVPENLFFIILIKMILDGFIGLYFVLNLKFLHFLAIIKAHFAFYLQISKLLNKRSLNTNFKYYEVKSIIWYYIKSKYINFFSK